MIYAADIDLRAIYCVNERGAVACKGAASLRIPDDCTVLLCEIASPVSFNRGGQSSAIMYNLAKWALWNVATITQLNFAAEKQGVRLLVCPSNVWTKGYDLKTRHRIANCTQPQKDLREAEAMIYFYKQEPKSWIPMANYLHGS